MQINNTIDLSGNAGSGEVGPAGPKGIQGETGPQGVPGIPGTDGVDGVDGVGGGSSVEKLRFLKQSNIIANGEVLFMGVQRYVPEVNKKIKRITIALDNQTFIALGVEIRDATTMVTVVFNAIVFTFANENTAVFEGADQLLVAGEPYFVRLAGSGDTSANLNENLNITVEVEDA